MDAVAAAAEAETAAKEADGDKPEVVVVDCAFERQIHRARRAN